MKDLDMICYCLGISKEDQERAERAIQMMRFKGNIQVCELRGQLSEVLPGAFNATAQILGVSTKKLSEMCEGGEVLATDELFEKLNKHYVKMCLPLKYRWDIKINQDKLYEELRIAAAELISFLRRKYKRIR